MNNIIKYFIWYCLITCITISYYSCNSESKELSSEEKYSVDTIYSNRIAAFRMEADSLCKIYNAQNYDRVRDSIQKETIEEIELLLNKKLLSE